MKIRSRCLHRCPTQPVRVRGGVGAFVEIPSPGFAGRRHGLQPFRQRSQGDAAAYGPGDGFGDLRLDDPRQGGMALYPIAQSSREFDMLVSAGMRVKMKEKGPAAVYFQVEIPRLAVWPGGEKEFDAAVSADALLMAGGHGPDVPVLHPKQQRNRLPVIGHLHVGTGEMGRSGPHGVAEPGRRDILPGREIPDRGVLVRIYEPFHSVDHIVLLQEVDEDLLWEYLGCNNTGWSSQRQRLNMEPAPESSRRENPCDQH